MEAGGFRGQALEARGGEGGEHGYGTKGEGTGRTGTQGDVLDTQRRGRSAAAAAAAKMRAAAGGGWRRHTHPRPMDPRDHTDPPRAHGSSSRVRRGSASVPNPPPPPCYTRLEASEACTHHEADGVEDVRLPRPVQTRDRVELRVEATDHGALRVRLEAVHDDLHDAHLVREALREDLRGKRLGRCSSDFWKNRNRKTHFSERKAPRPCTSPSCK